MILNLPVSYHDKFHEIIIRGPLFSILPVLLPLLESLTLPWWKKQLAINQQTWNNFPPECEISIICQDFITVQASNGPATTSALSRLIYVCNFLAL